MRLLNQIAVLMVAVLLSVGCSTKKVQKRVKVEKSSPLEIIKSNNELWVQSLNENNDNYLDLYLSSSHLVDNAHKSYKGKEEISSLYKSLISNGQKISGHKTLNIQSKTKVSYFEIGQYELSGDKNQIVVYGIVWKKNGGKLYKQFEMFNYKEESSNSLTQDELATQIEEAENKWEEKYHNHNVTTDLYVEDAYFYWGGGYIVQGAQNIVNEIAGGNDQLKPAFIEPISDSLVYEIGETEELNYLLVWKKVDGKWLMYIDSYIE